MRLLSILTFAAVTLGGVLNAADEAGVETPTDHETAGADQEEVAEEDVGAPAQTSGKVIATHTCKMVGLADPHIMVKVLTETGETDIVDLGSAEDLKSGGFEPREGQQLWVSGRVGTINDKKLLVAESLSESKLITIERTTLLREESQLHEAARKEARDAAAVKEAEKPGSAGIGSDLPVRVVEGTVIHTCKVAIDGQQEGHLLCKLKTEGGIVVVDLGVSGAIPKVDLSEGQWVVATGFVGDLNDKPIIVADSVGNLRSIKRVSPGDSVSDPARIEIPGK